jgi:hypothetical protein
MFMNVCVIAAAKVWRLFAVHGFSALRDIITVAMTMLLKRKYIFYVLLYGTNAVKHATFTSVQCRRTGCLRVSA